MHSLPEDQEPDRICQMAPLAAIQRTLTIKPIPPPTVKNGFWPSRGDLSLQAAQMKTSKGNVPPPKSDSVPSPPRLALSLSGLLTLKWQTLKVKRPGQLHCIYCK